jgi:leader peptidase (prepilin peptidase) / N-methyltransferase
MCIEMVMTLMLGLCFGSLNTLLVYRLPMDKPIGMVRSACPMCHTALGFPDLFPVLSWLWSRGACRHCRAPVSWRYPATELATALLFLGVYSAYGFTLDGLLIALLGSQLIALCIIDFEHRIIPDQLQLGMAATGIAYGLTGHLHPADMIAGALVGVGCGLVLQQGYRLARQSEGLGMGDVKFMAVAGLWLGVSPLLPFFFYAGILGVVSAVIWRWLFHDPYFPFGPALAVSLATLVCYPPSSEWFRELSVWMVTSLGIL